MNRLTVALLAALDALIVVAIGIGVALVPLTVMWAARFHLEVDWSVFWRASADAWLFGHGVDLTIALPKILGAAFGVTGAALSFPLTIAALGIALFVVLMGVRTGIRAAATEFRVTGVVVSVLTYGGLGAIVTASAGSAVAQPSLWQGIVLPPAVFAVGVLIGVGIGVARERARSASATGDAAPSGTYAAPSGGYAGHDATGGSRAHLTPASRASLAAALRGGAAATALTLAAAAVLVTVLLAADYARVVGLYESLQAGVLGAVVLTVAQLALLPNAVIWTASWLAGPGFTLGTGSSLAPAGSTVGPVPALPLLGILPHGTTAFALAGVLVPVVAGFAAGYLTRAQAARGTRPTISAGRLAGIALGIGCVAGIIMGLLAWFSAGAIGPGRLVDAGPNGWLVGLAIGAEVAVGAVIGVFALRRSR